MNEWISVKDRLPKSGERVIATNGIFCGEGYIGLRYKKYVWYRHLGRTWEPMKAVTHWMPFPEPPKEEEV